MTEVTTNVMTNEAANQLEKWVSGSDETLANFRYRVREALATERRNTVAYAASVFRAARALHQAIDYTDVDASTYEAWTELGKALKPFPIED